MGNTYGDKTLRMRTIYKILRQIKEAKTVMIEEVRFEKNPSKLPSLFAAVTAEVDADYEICIKSLAFAHGMGAPLFPFFTRTLGS